MSLICDHADQPSEVIREWGSGAAHLLWECGVHLWVGNLPEWVLGREADAGLLHDLAHRSALEAEWRLQA